MAGKISEVGKTNQTKKTTKSVKTKAASAAAKTTKSVKANKASKTAKATNAAKTTKPLKANNSTKSTETTKSVNPDQEIVFRISFECMNEPDELIVTRDGKYRFVDSKKLKKDRTDYKVIYPDSRYHLVKVNQKYYKQALKAKKDILEGEKDWPVYDFGKVAGRQPELYRKTLWLLSHKNFDGWKESFGSLDFNLTTRTMSYRDNCDLLYGDDHMSEYYHHEHCAQQELHKMKIYVAEGYSGKVSAAEFEQIFDQERKQILLVSLPRKGHNLVMYLTTAQYRITSVQSQGYQSKVTYTSAPGYIRRVECADDSEKLAEKIERKLEKDKKFERHAEYFDRANGDEIVGALFQYAYELDTGENYQQDRDLSYQIYQYIAKRWGEADAYYNLGLFHQEGYGSLEKDTKTAIAYYEKAIEKGDQIYAANNLGIIYNTGNGVPKDRKKALEYFELATDNGDIFAPASLAVAYEKGKGVKRDRLKALELYREALACATRAINLSDDYNPELSEFKDLVEKDIKRLEKKLK